MKPLYPLLAFATFVALAGAQTVSTDPVGFIPIVAKGNSDTYLALPLHRGLSFQGTVASVNQSTLTVNSAAFQTDGYKDTHYVLIASGAKEGMWYAITTNSPTAVTIELAGDTLGTAVASGTEIQIIPFWTLATLFPGGVGVHASPSFLPRTSVLIPDQARAGVNLAAAASFFYYSGTQYGGAGWRKFGNSPAVKFDSYALIPDTCCIVRHEIATDTTITIPGAVQMTSLANVVGTLASGRAQDNAIALNVAVPTSLTASNLFESGAFTGTATLGAPVDQLLVFDGAVAQKNRQPSQIFYFFLGTGPSDPLRGWRLVGDLTTIRNTELVFQPANGYILRKAASAQASSAVWAVRPSYVPQ
jgi:uncharacterized protein (TIGR02597 family)